MKLRRFEQNEFFQDLTYHFQTLHPNLNSSIKCLKW